MPDSQKQQSFKFLIAAFLLTLLATLGCSSNPPKDPDNICKIFEENRGWYKDSVKAKRKWGAPIHVPMAIMYQESSFRANAKPPRNTFLGVIPGRRKSSAKGYAQAQSPAWKDYVKASGNRFADRNDFADSVDFIQWYIDRTKKAYIDNLDILFKDRLYVVKNNISNNVVFTNGKLIAYFIICSSETGANFIPNTNSCEPEV